MMSDLITKTTSNTAKTTASPLYRAARHFTALGLLVLALTTLAGPAHAFDPFRLLGLPILTPADGGPDTSASDPREIEIEPDSDPREIEIEPDSDPREIEIEPDSDDETSDG